MSYLGAEYRKVRVRARRRLYIAVVTVLTVVGTLLGFSSAFWYSASISYLLTHIDPELMNSTAYPCTVYISLNAENLSKLDRSRIVKTWRFGDLVIVKYCARSLDEVKSIAQFSISVFGSMKPTFPEPISKWIGMIMTRSELTETLPIAIAYSGDIKRDYHRSRYLTGRGVVVCIVDSGVDYLHPDLRDAVKVLVSMLVRTKEGTPLTWIKGVNGTLEEAWEFERQLVETYNLTEYPWIDCNGHGTHCAGIVAGRGVASNGRYMGLAPASELVVVKAFSREGYSSSDIILDALEWIYRNAERFKIKVCSFSWGIPKASDGSDPISLACDKLVEKGIVVCVAMGNNYIFPYTINIPACAHKVISVGAMDPYLDQVASFSSAGPTIDGRIKPDCCGAGVWVVSCLPVTVYSLYEQLIDEYNLPLKIGEYYVMMSGTSMATPCVAGMCAKVVQLYREVIGREPTPEDVRKTLMSWCEKYALFGAIELKMKDIWMGYGVPREKIRS